MEKTNKYNYALYGALFGISAALLAWENHTFLWAWLFKFICLVFLTLLNDVFLRERHWRSRALTILQCAVIFLLAYTTAGYGSIPLAVAVQVGFSNRYGKKASVWITVILYTLLICVLYLSPGKNMTSPYPAIFIAVSGFVVMLLLLSVKDAMQLHDITLGKIVELQLNRKELRDLNSRMKYYNDDMKKITILQERSRMSKQIHDTLGHVLTAVSVQLGAAELLFEKNPKEALIKIANAKAQTREGLNSVKQTLSLIDEDHVQFEDRIFDIIGKARAGMNIKILAQISVKGDFSISVQEFILSALKEGITNGVRHGGASTFVFRFGADDGNLLFYLEDNGKGCEKINMGYGLTAMERQAQTYGGVLEPYSVKDEGFVLKIAIPCRRDAK
jgi:signal transduction histidine kinase